MKKFFRKQQNIVFTIFFAICFILMGRLFYLSVVDNKKWKNLSNNLSIKGIYNSSPRGSIFDRNGKVLATNQQVFSVKMRAGDLKNQELNEVSLEIINLLEKNGDSYTLDFPIEYKDGEYKYKYDDEIAKWLEENELSSSLGAEEAFFALRDKLGIESQDRYEIQKEMQSKYNIYPPILVKDMTYRSSTEKKNFLESYGIKKDFAPSEAILSIKKYFDIDENLQIADQMKVISVRNVLKSAGYRKYMSVTIANGVSQKTVIDIEEGNYESKGVEVSSESKRIYPQENLASHILGYLGKISSSEKAEYEKKGYEATDLVGKEGIEGKFENVLKGQAGTDIIMVNAKGAFVSNVKSIEGKKGKDVYLTIDSDLQKHAEDSLKRAIEACKTGGIYKSEFGNIATSKAPKVKSGAVVAMEVETGDVLAMASYPDFNPNLFTEGISQENWQNLQSSNPRDSLSASPLLNMATMTAVQPGSTFKPITAMAGLEAGMSASRQVKDEGVIKLGNRTFACYRWNQSRGNHGYMDMYKAMQYSCNYYFYDIITNKDWSTGNSLGLDSSMGIDKVLGVADRMGLNEKTGIQINEVAFGLPTESGKIKGLQASLKNRLYANAENYFKEEVYSNSKRLEKDINTIVDWMNIQGMTYSKMKEQYLPEVGVKEDKYKDVIELCLYEYYNQSKWTTADAFNISIGQGSNAYTPIQMARYISTLGNFGYRNEANIIKSIEDEGDYQKKDAVNTNLNKEYVKQILESMYRVSSQEGSGINRHYQNFPWQVSAKTGTAQKSGKINPKSEVDYIKSHLSSFGNISWEQVENEMKRLMKEYPKTYSSEDVAVRRAVINLSGNKLTTEELDRYKENYDEFAWTVALAPKKNPKIAVACVLPQGLMGGNANLVVREIIGQYLKQIDENYKEFELIQGIN